MSIPVLDAINSKRVGMIQEDDYCIPVILHDESEEAVAGGEIFRRSSPIGVHAPTPISIEATITSPNEESLVGFSDEFLQQCYKIYRGCSEKHYDGEIAFDELSDYEAEYINRILGILANQDEVNLTHTNELWSTVVKPAHRYIDTQKNNVEMFNNQWEFESGTYTQQQYIPEFDYINRWGLHIYSHNTDGYNSSSLWVRYEDLSENHVELPLFYQSDLLTVVSKDPSFGEIEDSHISTDLQQSLETGESGNLSEDEMEVFEMVQRLMDKSDIRNDAPMTAKIINEATKSEDISEKID